MVRERFYRHAPSNYQLNKKIKKLQEEPEIKYKDAWHTISATRTPDSQGQVFLLNGTQVGPYATGERIGSQIRATSIQLRGYFYIPILGVLNTPETDTLRAPMIRLIVFWVTNPVGTPVIVGNSDTALDGVLDNIIGSTADNIFAPYQFQSYPAIKVLYDKTYTFKVPPIVRYDDEVTPNRPESTAPYVMINKKIKLSRLVKYNGEQSTISNFTNNALYMTAISTYDAASGPGYRIAGQIFSRFCYKDD